MTNTDCVFCNISGGKINSDLLYETEKLMVFKDIHPSAPIHYLIVPRKHYADLSDTPDDVWVAVKDMALVIQKEESHKGFRIGNNFGSAAEIKHMHVHYLSGITKTRKL